MPIEPEELMPFIPLLRRHARLLSGTKEIGDEYVRLCLELVMAEPERLERDDLRLSLFAAFHQCWKVVSRVTVPSPDAVDQAERLDEGLASLAPLERRVLLLSVVEDFTPEQVGRILELTETAVRDQLRDARDHFQQLVRVPVLIIEDEPMIAMELKDVVESMGLRVTGMASRQDQATAAAESEPPGLVLSDIQLEDEGSGIEAARDILQNYEVPIVFVTGYPERLLTGDGLEPAFVIAKPFKQDGLKAAIAQALSTYAAPENAVEHRTRLLAKLRKISARELQQRS